MTNNSDIQQGYFILADISGYTGFLATNELDHSRKITTEIIDLLISSLTPALNLAEVEGDAVFVYSPQNRITRGETLLELIESTYVKFKNHVVGLKSCDCKGCESALSLDLKFVCHFGQYVLQDAAGKLKPLGSDINLSHRLLKNSVSILTGWQAYALFTETCLNTMEMKPDGMRKSVESYEHLGKVITFNLNLDSRYDELIAKHRPELNKKEADDIVTIEIPAPLPIVWEWLNDCHKRNLWNQDTVWEKTSLTGGRTSVGATNQCTRGSGKYLEQILEWKPFEFFSTRYQLKPFPAVITTTLQPVNGGTKLIRQITFDSYLPKKIFRPIYKYISRKKIKLINQMERMRDLIMQ